MSVAGRRSAPGTGSPRPAIVMTVALLMCTVVVLSTMVICVHIAEHAPMNLFRTKLGASFLSHLIFGLEQAVDVVEAVEDEADGGGGDLVVAAKVGGGGVAGVGGEHPAAAVVAAVGRVT